MRFIIEILIGYYRHSLRVRLINCYYLFAVFSKSGYICVFIISCK